MTLSTNIQHYLSTLTGSWDNTYPHDNMTMWISHIGRGGYNVYNFIYPHPPVDKSPLSGDNSPPPPYPPLYMTK